MAKFQRYSGDLSPLETPDPMESDRSYERRYYLDVPKLSPFELFQEQRRLQDALVYGEKRHAPWVTERLAYVTEERGRRGGDTP